MSSVRRVSALVTLGFAVVMLGTDGRAQQAPAGAAGTPQAPAAQVLGGIA